jgi:hypothetical protein
MLRLFQKQTRDDPKFGPLVKKRAAWVGTLRTPLFPEIDLAISIMAQNEEEFAGLRNHLGQVTAHCESIRSQIANEALETYKFYKEESEAAGDTATYSEITSRDRIWPLVKPLKWIFESGKEFKSRVVIDFGWPNDHYLVAYLADTELYHLDVQG